MNHFDNELKIIEHFQGVNSSDVYFINKSTQAERMFTSIYDVNLWNHWTNNSAKNAPPPDFYSDKYNLMMEVMRIDDHASIDEKGKIVNPTNKRESELQREIKDSGILDAFPNVKNVIAIPHTQLSTNGDHSYQRYKSNFIRVVEKHSRQVELYKINFPNKKVIFFVLDESCAYIKTNTPYNGEDICAREIEQGRPHFWFYDKDFVDAIRNSGVDYFIWYAPFKLFRSLEIGILDLPKACIYDNTKKLTALVRKQLTHYDERFIKSSEA